MLIASSTLNRRSNNMMNMQRGFGGSNLRMDFGPSIMPEEIPSVSDFLKEGLVGLDDEDSSSMKDKNSEKNFDKGSDSKPIEEEQKLVKKPKAKSGSQNLKQDVIETYAKELDSLA